MTQNSPDEEGMRGNEREKAVSFTLSVNIQLPDLHVATVTLFSYITTLITTLWCDIDVFPPSLPLALLLSPVLC